MNNQNNFIAENSRRLRNPIMYAVLILVFIAIFVWFVVLPKKNSLQLQKLQLNYAQEQEQSLKFDEETLNKLVAELESSDKEIKTLDEAIPLDARPTSTALLIESYANSAGMTVGQLSLADIDLKFSAGDKELISDPYNAQRELVEQEILLVVTGSIDQFSGLLQLLENSGRLIDVKSMDVSVVEALTFRLSLKVYEYAPENSAITSDTQGS
ncbi:MAG: hypothetical protein R3B41_04040 [Candidatus Doudnabacteria bacterium]